MPAMHKLGAFVTPITLARGISLLELLVVLAILAIMAGLALPSFEGMVRRWRTQAAADSLVSAIYLARNEAARYGGVQLLSRNEPGCQRATGQWQCGWQIQTLGAKPQVLQMAEANRRVRITRSPANNVMGFNQFGQLNGLGAYSFVVEHVADLGDGSKAITICASSAGRLRTVRDRNSCN